MSPIGSGEEERRRLSNYNIAMVCSDNNKGVFVWRHLYVAVVVVVATSLLVSGAVDEAVLKAELAYLNFVQSCIDSVTWNCNAFNPLRQWIYNLVVKKDKVNVLVYYNNSYVSLPVTNATAALTTNSSLFNINARTMMYVHGFNGLFMDSSFDTWGKDVLAKGNYNFLIFDLSQFLHGADYVYIAGMPPMLGDILSGFISELYDKGMLLSNLHIVGHSMGAQISGYAARTFTKKYNVKWPRITALDPAAPCFVVPGVTAISPNDATFVDVIRTSVLSHKFDSIGHVEYVVNVRNGTQPGCTNNIDIPCAHSRARLLFMESINNELGFIAKKCWNITTYDCNVFDLSAMGYAANPSTRGTFFLKTNDKSPYAMGLGGIA